MNKVSKIIGILLPFLVLLRIGMETYTNSFGANWHFSGNAIVGAIPMLALGYCYWKKNKNATCIDALEPVGSPAVLIYYDVSDFILKHGYELGRI